MRRAKCYISLILLSFFLVSAIPCSAATDAILDAELADRVERDLIEIVFRSDMQVRLRNNVPMDILHDAVLDFSGILSDGTVRQWIRTCSAPEDMIDRMYETAAANLDQPVYNMNNAYRVWLRGGENVFEVCRQLEKHPAVMSADPVPVPPPLPSPGNYQGSQGYLTNSASWPPTGISALYAWTQMGGTGAGVTVCDIEYSWNYSHGDLTKAPGSQLHTGCSDPYADTNHGTAVLGELVSDNNGWGTTGICYGAGLYTCCSYYGSPLSWNPAGAITTATASMNAGDVILLEQQWDYSTGSTGVFVPVEWYNVYPPVTTQTANVVYNAIVTAVGNGIHVVEAAGNGNYNLDSLSWITDSGAIIVGAGGAVTSGDLTRMSFSSYGSRVNLQGWGEDVVTTGYNDLYAAEGVNYYYTATFNGTSSASPIIAGAVACSVGYWVNGLGYGASSLTPGALRNILSMPANSTAQVMPPTGNIGPRPDLQPVFNYLSTMATPTPLPTSTPTSTPTTLVTATPTPSGTAPPPAGLGIQMNTACSSEWDATAFNNARRMVRDSDGYFHAVWHSQCVDEGSCNPRVPGNPPAGGRPCGIFYARTLVPADGSIPGSIPPPWVPGMEMIWTPPSPIATTAGDIEDDRYPAIAIEHGLTGDLLDNDRLHVVWQRERAPGGVYDIFYATCINEPATPPVMNWEPFSGAGVPGMLDLYVSHDDFSGLMIDRNSLVPSIDVGGGNVVHVVWQEEDYSTPDGINYFSEILYKGSIWPQWLASNQYTANVSLSPITNSQMPSIACSLDDPVYNSPMVHVVFNDDASATPPEIFYSMNPMQGDPVQWLPPAPISGAFSGGADGYPCIAVNPADIIHITWMHNVLSDDPDTVMFLGRDGYGPGVDPLDLGGTQESFPGPEVGMYGTINNVIYHLDLLGGVATVISPGLPGDDEFPTIFIDMPTMNVGVVWQRWDTIGTWDYELWYNDSATMWMGILPYNMDPGHDDLFPSTAFKKETYWYNGPVLPKLDLIWTKIDLDGSGSGHGRAAALSPAHALWMYGTSKYVTPFRPIPALSVTGILILLILAGFMLRRR